MEVPFGTIRVYEKSKELIKNALDTNRISSGRLVDKFEKQFSDLIHVKNSIAVSSGTDADTLALAALHDFGAKRQDEIIMPALSFVATANSAYHAGFVPKFVDIKSDTLNIDPEKIENAISPKTKAIMPVHLMGKPAEMDKIMKIAKKHDLYVIEDAAEAHGGKINNKELGTIGHAGAFSLYVAHIITTGEGGIITTNDDELDEIIRSLRSHGRACKCKSCILNKGKSYCHKRFESGFDKRFIFERIGYSTKMNELEAAIGLGSLEAYHEIVKKRRNNLLYLMNKIKKFNDSLFTFSEEEGEEIGPHAMPIIIKEDQNFSREDLCNFLEKKSIQTRTLFASIPTQYPAYSFMGHKLGEFGNAEFIGQNGFHIGVHQDLEKEHLDYVIGCIEEFSQI